MRARTALWLLLAAPVWLPAWAAVQDDIEEVSITEQGTLDPFSVEDRELGSIFDEAERLFRSMEQPDSIALFDRLIARLEAGRARAPLPPELRAMLIQSRAHRAEAHFNLGQNEVAAKDLRAILELEPGWRANPDLVSPKLIEVIDKLRDELVGELMVLVDPIDARVTLDGEPIEFVGQPAAALAGARRLAITRPGYTSVEEEIDIRAGRSTTVEHTLERLSAVVRVRTRPAGASVLLDGAPAAVAQRVELAGPEPEEDLAIEGLEPGRHVIELRLAEHRPLRLGFEVLELDDYRLPPARLELMSGEIRLSGLPPGAALLVDGEPVEPAGRGEGVASVTLAPGDHQVEVRKAGIGGFRESVSVGDQEVVDLAVELTPTIAFLGVLGSDRLAATELSKQLAARFQRLGQWLWHDHSIEAPAVLDAAGLSAAEMRRLASLASQRAAPDWSAIQGSFDDRFGASVHLLAVLGDDLFATSADLWLWSPAPWPAAPGLRTVPLGDGGAALERLAAAFDSTVVPRHPYLGAQLVEVDGLVIASVVPGGPAAAAGLEVGERVVSISGQPAANLAAFRAAALGHAGGDVALGVGSTAAPRQVRVSVPSRPGVVTLSDTALVDQVLAARLALALESDPTGVPRWLLELNQAALYLRASSLEAAVPLLRTIEAPAGAGLSRAMVDYWLATTLMSVDARAYADAARAALDSALAQEGARLYHADGPLLAPRARARLAELDRLLGISGD